MDSFTKSELKSIAAAVLYVVVSGSMTFFNKAVLSEFDFDYPFTILGIQLAVTIWVLKALAHWRLIPLEVLTMDRARKMFIISMLYSANVGIALSALSRMNIPMYSTLKRVTVCVVLIGEFLILGKRASQAIAGCVVAIAIGALVAGAGDIQFSFLGYCLGMLSCLSQAGYLLFVAKREEESGMSTFGLLYYNCALSLPFVFIFSVLSGELSAALAYPQWFSLNFLVCLGLACFFGAFLNYSIFLCTTVNSPLTLTVSGQFKSIATVGIGIFTFGGVKLTALSLVGWLINTSGSLGYSYLKFKEKRDKTSLPMTDSQSKPEDGFKGQPQNGGAPKVFDQVHHHTAAPLDVNTPTLTPPESRAHRQSNGTV